MKIQTKITLWFVGITTVVYVLFMSLVYFSAYRNRANEFYSILEKEAITKVNLLLETQLDAETLQTIYRKNREVLYEVEVAIYDAEDNLIYHDAVDIDVVKETPEMLAQIREKESIKFFQDKWQVVGFLVEIQGVPYSVTAAAYDGYGFGNLENIRNSILASLFFVILAIFFLARYFSGKILKPLSDMVMEVELITASNLDLRLNPGKNKDELAQLADTFNQLLERLEQSFDSQKQFVSYVAHELRTPLAAMISEMEWAERQDRSIEEYQETLSNLLSDAHKMAKISSTLLDFAKASYDRTEINFKPIRVDEILLDASRQVLRENKHYRVEMDFAGEFEEEAITVHSNAYLLTIAFVNLMENACKYSKDNSCKVSINANAGNCEIIFIDQGPGIPKSEQQRIFQPFFRGTNKNQATGSGIGLTLSQKIIQQHNGEIKLKSSTKKGSIFTITLPVSSIF